MIHDKCDVLSLIFHTFSFTYLFHSLLHEGPQGSQFYLWFFTDFNKTSI